jgi:hypothetical protein
MLSALAHRMLGDHVHLWTTFVFVCNTCVSLDITKTSPQDNLGYFCVSHPLMHVSITPHFQALRLRFTICIPCLLHHSTYVVNIIRYIKYFQNAL